MSGSTMKLGLPSKFGFEKMHDASSGGDERLRGFPVIGDLVPMRGLRPFATYTRTAPS